MCGARLWKWTIGYAIDLGFVSVPDDYHAVQEVYPYGANNVEVRIICANERVTLPDVEDVSPLEWPESLIAGGIFVVGGVKST